MNSTDFMKNIKSEFETSVFAVKVKDSGLLSLLFFSGGNGTGFAIENNILVTNFHVLTGVLFPHYDLSEILITNYKQNYTIKKIIGASILHDIAALEIEKFQGKALKLNFNPDEKEKDFYAIGYPQVKDDEDDSQEDKSPLELLEKAMYSEKEIVPVKKGNDVDDVYHQFFWTCPHWEGGASGSPIINKKKEVVGIVGLGSPFSAHVVKLKYLKQLLTGSQENVTKNIHKWVRKKENALEDSARSGNVMAQFRLAEMLFDSDDEEERQQSPIWFKRAAKKGHTMSASKLGSLYFQGIGVKKDLRKGMPFVRQAAKGGIAASQENLAASFLGEFGKWEGVPNPDEAIYWYTLAAEQGNVAAQINLGKIFYHGIMEKYKNLKKAKFWISKAAEQNLKEAIEFQEDL